MPPADDWIDEAAAEIEDVTGIVEGRGEVARIIREHFRAVPQSVAEVRALLKYGRHIEGCSARINYGMGHGICTCGFDAVRAAIEGAATGDTR